ncbi:MAG: Hpt domain-containing protein [Polyangiaceae bacterium]
MTIDMLELREIFFDEANEHLAAMGAALLALEHAPHDRELINQIFRAAHSIKGGSGAFGFGDLLRFTHSLEGLLQLVRDERLSFDASLVDLLLRATDTLRELVTSTKREEAPPGSLDDLLVEMERKIAGDAILAEPRGPFVARTF